MLLKLICDLFALCVCVQVYLVDYGLAYRYSPDGVLKEYKEDPKRCHDGTIEFTSIDAHKGACKYILSPVVWWGDNMVLILSYSCIKSPLFLKKNVAIKGST